MKQGSLRPFSRENLSRTIALALAAAVLLVFWGEVIAGALRILFGACVLTFLLSPIAALLEKQLKRPLAALLAILGVALVLLLALALLLCWGSPVSETHSPRVLLRGEAGLGARRPSAPRPQPCPLSQLGRAAPKPRRTDGPKRASGSCILQRETLLGQQTTDSTRLRSRKQRKPFSPPAPRSP